MLGDSRRVGARRRVLTLRELVVAGLVASGLAASGVVTLDQAIAAADPPAVLCSTNGTTLDVQLSGQSSSSDTLGIAASSGDYVIYLGAPGNAQCTVGGPYALADEPDVDVTSSGMVSQYVTLDDTNGQLASSSVGCAVAVTVALDTPTSGTDTIAVLDDSSAPSAGDDTVSVSSMSSGGMTSESLNLSEGGCNVPEVGVAATASPPDVDVAGQAGTGDVLDLSATTTSSTTAVTVDANGDSTGSPGAVSGEPGDIAVGFSGIEAVLGASFATDFQPGTASGMQFEGQPGVTNTLDLSGEGSPAQDLVVNATSGTVSGTSSGGGALSDGFSEVQHFLGSPVGTTFDAPGSGGLTFDGVGTGTDVDLSAAPSGATVDVATGTVSGLSAGVGSSTTDSVSGIGSLTGSSAGSTTFVAAGSGGLSFHGKGAGNSLDLGAAPSGTTIDAASGTVSGLASGVGSSTTDTYSDVATVTGSGAGSTTFDAAASGGLTFKGQGTGNSLDLSATPSGATVSVSTGTVSGLSSGAGSSTTDATSDIASFTGSTFGSTTFDSTNKGGFTFIGQGAGNSLDLSAAPSGATVNVATGTVSGLTAGVGSSTTDSVSGIEGFTGSTSGSTSFVAPGSGGLTFSGKGTGNALDLSAAPSGTAVHLATGTVTGLASGVGSSTSDAFSDVAAVTGSSVGSTAFDPTNKGGFTFVGQGAGNSLDLSVAPTGMTIDAATGSVSGLAAGVASSTTDSVSGIEGFTGSTAGSTTFDAAASGGLTFNGQGTGNSLDLSAAPSGANVDVATGTVSGLASGVGSSTTDSYSDVAAVTGSSAGSTTFTATGSGGLSFHGKGTGNSLDLSAAPSGEAVDVTTGTVSGLTAGIGSSTTDAFSDIEDFTGSTSGSTAFTATGSGGITFDGLGTGDSLDLGAAPSGATVDAATGAISGLTAGAGSSTTDEFSGIASFTGSASGTTSFAVAGSGGFTFDGQGTGNSLDLSAAPPGATVDIGVDSHASPGVVSGLTGGILASTTDEFSDVAAFTGSLAPSEPTGPTATALDGSAKVSFVAPAAQFGTPITGYAVTATDLTTSANGGEHTSGTTSPITITGLINGDSYEFTISATNTNGTGPSSVASSAVTPLRAQSVRFTTATANTTHVHGTSYTPIATASSGMPVTIALDVTSSGCVLTDGVVSFPNAGVCVIDASQGGGGIYAPAQTVRQRITVLKGVNTITVTKSPPRDAKVPESYRPSAFATSGDHLTIHVAAHLTACVLHKGVVEFVEQGLCVVVFSDAGNADYLANEAIQRFAIARGSVTMRAMAIPRAASSSLSITLRAIVSTILARGAVRFTIGNVGLCSASVQHKVASCRVLKALGKGTYRVTASYLGSPGFAPTSTVTDLRVT